MRSALWTATLVGIALAGMLTVEAQHTRDGLTHSGTTSRPLSIRGNTVLTMHGGVPVLFDMVAGVDLVRFKGMRDPVWEMALSPDGRRVATTTSNGEADFVPNPLRHDMQIWDAASGKLLLQFPLPYGSELRWSPDSRAILLTGDKLTRVWDVDSGAELPGFDGMVSFDDSGRTTVVVTGSDIKLLEGLSRRQRCEIHGSDGMRFTSPVFAPDGRRIAAVVRYPHARDLPDYDATREVRVWSADNCGVLLSLPLKADTFTQVSFTPEGSGLLINLSRPAVAEIVDVQNGNVLKSFRPAPAEYVTDAQLSEDGYHLLTRSSFYTDRDRLACTLWDVRDGRALHRWDEDWDGYGCAGFTGDSRNAIIQSFRSFITLWSAETGERISGGTKPTP